MAKQKLWLTKDYWNSYVFWNRCPCWGKNSRVWRGSKSDEYTGRLFGFCPKLFEKTFPQMRKMPKSSLVKVSVEIKEIGKIIKA